MEITVDRDILLKSLGYAYGIIEKKSALPILSNVLIEATDSKMRITTTDLDIIYSEEIPAISVDKKGSTTTSANILYDILRKLLAGSKVALSLKNENKLQLISGNSKFNLLCITPDNFPLSNENFEASTFKINSKNLLKLLNKTKIAISNDETRHYLNGIFLHKSTFQNQTFLTAVSTDSHRLSHSSVQMNSNIDFEPSILPKKTVFQLIPLLENNTSEVEISNNKSKIKFINNNSFLISKVIDGKFPDYKKVVPQNNEKILEANLSDFKNSIERVTSVSADRKEGVKMFIMKDNLQLSVNSPNSGEGTENIKAKYNADQMIISFNSRYLIDIASQIEGNNIIINLQNPGSPALIKDPSDKDSFYVIMPMKI